MTEKQLILIPIIIFIIGILGLFVMSQDEKQYLINKHSTDDQKIYLPENKLLILEARVVEQTSSTRGSVLTLEINQSIKAFFDSKINQTLKGKQILIKGFFKNNWLNVESIKIKNH